VSVCLKHADLFCSRHNPKVKVNVYKLIILWRHIRLTHLLCVSHVWCSWKLCTSEWVQFFISREGRLRDTCSAKKDMHNSLLWAIFNVFALCVLLLAARLYYLGPTTAVMCITRARNQWVNFKAPREGHNLGTTTRLGTLIPFRSCTIILCSLEERFAKSFLIWVSAAV
jgi:hypothetical protein